MEKLTPDYAKEAQILAVYANAVFIMHDQLSVLKSDETTDPITSFNQLSSQFLELVQTIDESPTGIKMSSEAVHQYQHYLFQMNEYQQEIDAILLKRYDSLSGSMKLIKNHKTVVRAYGGVSLKDTIPLYLDEKQ